MDTLKTTTKSQIIKKNHSKELTTTDNKEKEKKELKRKEDPPSSDICFCYHIAMDFLGFNPFYTQKFDGIFDFVLVQFNIFPTIYLYV